MKITVNRIPAEGMAEEFTADPSTMDMDRVDIHPKAPLTVASWITKAEREVVVQASIKCTVSCECGRCLQAFDRPIEVSTVLAYEVQPTDVLDITDDVRQEVILAYPMSPVCSKTCKGLCAICGQNLNTGTCPHQER